MMIWLLIAALVYLWIMGALMAYAIIEDLTVARYRRLRAAILVPLWPVSLPSIMVLGCFSSWPDKQGLDA